MNEATYFFGREHVEKLIIEKLIPWGYACGSLTFVYDPDGWFKGIELVFKPTQDIPEGNE